jgi:hypothetical protein
MLPDFETLTVDHKYLIEDHLKLHPPEISELTFTNLFIWRNYYRFQVARHLGFLTLLARPTGTMPFIFPPVGQGDIKAWAGDCLEYLRGLGLTPRLGRLPETTVREISALPNLQVAPDRDNSDYVYRTRNLVLLSGNKYHTLKNHINRVSKRHSWEYRPLTADLVEECLSLQEEWCRTKQCFESPGLAAEEEAIIEALKHMESLSYKGAVLLIKGKVEAFTMGELLNPETVVIHIEKANPNLPGLYPLIQQQFLKNEWEEVTFVNREQDLGVAGLRKSKLSYHPEFMVNKYLVTRP